MQVLYFVVVWAFKDLHFYKEGLPVGIGLVAVVINRGLKLMNSKQLI